MPRIHRLLQDLHSVCVSVHRRFLAEELQHIQDAFMQAAPKHGDTLDLEHFKVRRWYGFVGYLVGCWNPK